MQKQAPKKKAAGKVSRVAAIGQVPSLKRERDTLRAELDRLTMRLARVEAALNLPVARTAEQRKRDALRIAAKHGAKTVAAAQKLRFTDEPTARQKVIARSLAQKAESALKTHGTRAT